MTNKFFSGKLKEVVGSAKEPVSADNKIVIIPVSNDGKFETVPGNKSFAGYSQVTNYANTMYRAFYREKEDMDFASYRTKLIGAGLDYCLVSCYNGDVFDITAFTKAFLKISKEVRENKQNVHFNKASIPEDKYDDVVKLIESELLSHGINVYVYKQG
jgi:hypothetical protein